MNINTRKLLGICLLLANCDYSEGSLSFRDNTSLALQETPTGGTQVSIIWLNSFLSMLATPEERARPCYCHLLYDHPNTDAASFLLGSAGRRFDMTILKYDDATSATTLSQGIRYAVSSAKYILVFCSPTDVVKIFEMVKEKGLERYSVLWLIILKDRDENQTIADLEKVLREGIRVILVVGYSEGTITFRSTFVNLEGAVRFQKTANQYSNASQKDTLPGFLKLTSSPRDPQMKGRELILAANDNWPFFGIGRGPGSFGGRKRNVGIDVSIVDTLSSSLNFTYRVVSPADGKWGGPLPNGTVTGLIGMVNRHEADLAICEITVTSGRESVVDFTNPYYQESITLISRAPAEKSRTFAVFSPFTVQVWIIIVVSCLAMGPILKLEYKVLARYLREKKVPKKEAQLSSSTYAFNMFRSLMLQGNPIETPCWSRRFIFYFWYIFCLMVSALYSGTLTAVLAIPAYEKPVDSLNDLPKAIKDGFTLGTVKDSSLEFLFKEAKEGIYQDVWKLFNHADRSKSFLDFPEQGFDKVLQGKFVFICPRLASEIFARKRGRRKFYFARHNFYPQGYGIACTSGSPFKKIFDRKLARMVEAGLIIKWATDEAQKVSMIDKTPSNEEGTDQLAITLQHLQAAFFVLMLGYLIAALALVAENIHKRHFGRPTDEEEEIDKDKQL
ncbi:glutamate receptor ionotropic, delta-1-like [Macrobrachium nipponense]|uniref:glutamate receptor ionotropic, delta-1-like n=1 Tax=Macrobrachium nipponense TaxID=159736 RepID=UPI0030C88AA6